MAVEIVWWAGQRELTVTWDVFRCLCRICRGAFGGNTNIDFFLAKRSQAQSQMYMTYSQEHCDGIWMKVTVSTTPLVDSRALAQLINHIYRLSGICGGVYTVG